MERVRKGGPFLPAILLTLMCLLWHSQHLWFTACRIRALVKVQDHSSYLKKTQINKENQVNSESLQSKFWPGAPRMIPRTLHHTDPPRKLLFLPQEYGSWHSGSRQLSLWLQEYTVLGVIWDQESLPKPQGHIARSSSPPAQWIPPRLMPHLHQTQLFFLTQFWIQVYTSAQDWLKLNYNGNPNSKEVRKWVFSFLASIVREDTPRKVWTHVERTSQSTTSGTRLPLLVCKHSMAINVTMSFIFSICWACSLDMNGIMELIELNQTNGKILISYTLYVFYSTYCIMPPRPICVLIHSPCRPEVHLFVPTR